MALACGRPRPQPPGALARRPSSRGRRNGRGARRAAAAGEVARTPSGRERAVTSSVDIIIVNWNGRDDTLRCLAAVEPQLRDVDGAIITVVDNGSTDGSIAAITSKHRDVRFLP